MRLMYFSALRPPWNPAGRRGNMRRRAFSWRGFNWPRKTIEEVRFLDEEIDVGLRAVLGFERSLREVQHPRGHVVGAVAEFLKHRSIACALRRWCGRGR